MAQARLRRFVDPTAQKALRSHGEATPALKNALWAAVLGCVAAALVYTAHDLLPRAVAALTGDGSFDGAAPDAALPEWLAPCLDLLAALCLGSAASQAYRAWVTWGVDTAVLELHERQLALLGLSRPPGTGKPPLPSPARPAGAAAGAAGAGGTPGDTGLRRRQPEAAYVPSARASPGGLGAAPSVASALAAAMATPPSAPPAPSSPYGAASTPYGASPASLGFPSPGGSASGPIETPEELEDYLRRTERRRSDGLYSLVSSPEQWRLLSPYRASPPPRAAAVSPAAAAAFGEGPEALHAALRALLPRQHLELWTDRLREWAAAHVLQPLRHLLDTSHVSVAVACAAIPSMTQLQPSPLGAQALPLASGTIPGGVGASPGGGGGGGASPGGAARTPNGSAAAAAAAATAAAADPSAEEALLLRVLKEQLLPAYTPPPTPPQLALLDGARDAIVRHLSLMALLRGAAPAGLLAALPPAYVASRVRSLAVGSCMPAFAWAGGGDWAGRRWSPELPDDSALLLYLISAFLLAPGWRFSAEALLAGGAGAAATAHAGGTGGPLFVAALPPRPPERYAAVLVAPARPPAAHTGALALSAAVRSQQPRFTVYAGGAELAAVTGHSGLLHALVLFFLHAHVRGGGALGPARLDSPLVALASIFTEAGDRL